MLVLNQITFHTEIMNNKRWEFLVENTSTFYILFYGKETVFWTRMNVLAVFAEGRHQMVCTDNFAPRKHV